MADRLFTRDSIISSGKDTALVYAWSLLLYGCLPFRHRYHQYYTVLFVVKAGTDREQALGLAL